LSLPTAMLWASASASCSLVVSLSWRMVRLLDFMLLITLG
jgi:hypothetical protein